MRRFRNSSSGFTLVEMLAVIGVVALVMAAITPMVFSTLMATKLTMAGDAVISHISLAQQMAASKNIEVEVRFYSYMDPDSASQEPAVKAIALVQAPLAVPVTGGGVSDQGTALAETYYLPAGVAIARSARLSPLLSALGDRAADRERLVRKAPDANYVAMRFFPDGSTNVTEPITQSYITVGEERVLSGDVPDNFFAIQVDPVNGRPRAYRPGS